MLALLSAWRWPLILGLALAIVGGAYFKGRLDGYAIRNSELVAQYTDEIQRVRDEAKKSLQDEKDRHTREYQAAQLEIARLKARGVVVQTQVEKVKEYIRVQVPRNAVCDVSPDRLRYLNSLREHTLPTARGIDGEGPRPDNSRSLEASPSA